MVQSVHLLILLLFLYRKCIKCEIYSAISAMEPLLTTHRKITVNFDTYLRDEKKRIGILKYHLERFKTEHDIAIRNVSQYLANPLNGFTLIKRLTMDLEFIEKKIKDKTVYRRNKLAVYPTTEDVIGTAKGIARLHKTYKLNITAISNGELTGNFTHDNHVYKERMLPMSTSDCFELGRALYGINEFEIGLQWFLESYNKYRIEDDEPFNEENIIEHIVMGYYTTKNIESSILWAKRQLALLSFKDHNYEHVKSKIQKYEQQAKERQLSTVSMITDTVELNDYKETQVNSLCRGELEVPALISKRLRCRYLQGKHPVLKLAAIKMEQVHINPNIYLFYDVISSYEIDLLKKLAKPKLNLVKVLDSNELTQSKFRYYQAAILDDNEADVVGRLSRRVSHFSGLDVDTAEPFEVTEYGVAGHNEPHYDFLESGNQLLDNGNRIATALFYQSDVSLGGATVFPELSLTVYPVKGAAIFWYNLNNSGEVDKTTKHTGCPVLRGDKWILSKWLHQRGQEFRRLCPKRRQKKTATSLVM